MGKITKWAVETATDAMNVAIDKKMREFDKKFPKKGVALSVADMARIAVKDPEWQKAVVTRATRGRVDIDLRPRNLEEDSPMVAAAVKKIEDVDAKRDETRGKFAAELRGQRDEILQSAIIGDCNSADLLSAVKQFCK